MKLFTSESVTEGHPDKVCDKIADSILDAIIAQDSKAHVACEVCVTTGLVVLLGEVSGNFVVDYEQIVRDTIKEIGYESGEYGFDYRSCGVINALHKQSSDIAQGVNNSNEHRATNEEFDLIGAGDQGMMFGYASNETEELMPLAITLAHKLTMQLTKVRKDGTLSYLRPDGKAQVTVEYDDNGKAQRVHTIVVSTQHSADVDMAKLKEDVINYVIKAVIPSELLDENVLIYINPTGRFVIGGPNGDSGVTGRKIIVDTYGGYCAHGGGALSGKDPTKVDRSAMYMARYICKNLVASGICERVQLQVAYAIGRANPVSVNVNTHHTGVVSDSKICEIVNKVFDMRPAAIIKTLKLDSPIYANTSNYGHFGRTGFTWENTDKVDDIKRELQLIK